MVSDFCEIDDYYLLGDLQTAALVSKRGSIDWLCLPYFDSPSVFANILDHKAGFFSIESQGFEVEHGYVPETAVVEFSFTSKKSSFILRDAMVPQQVRDCKNQYLVRQVTGKMGSTDVSFILDLKPEYGQTAAELTITRKQNHTLIEAVINNGTVLLYLPEDSDVKRLKNQAQIHFTISKDQTKQLVLEFVHKGSDRACQMESNYMDRTLKMWQQWVKKGKYFSWCRDNLIRSAITLKLMQFYPTGALIAAPTTSLPEEVGGVRNWDYRYVWIRDATFTLNSLAILGYKEEAEKFFEFIEGIVEQASEKDFNIHLMYTIHGKKVPDEKELALTGYKQSSPVRVGNQASSQFQLDVYGTLIDTFYYVFGSDLNTTPTRKKLLMNLVKKISNSWQKIDNGIWEVREQKRHYTYSKVMAWVGLDRALKMAEPLGMTDQDKLLCETTEKEIYSWIWQNCFDEQHELLRQHPNTSHQDATNFLFVLLGFLDKDNQLTKQIIAKTREELCSKEVFVRRYINPDGIQGSEGAFILCTFWMISALAILGEHEQAKRLFGKFEHCMVDSSLLSEELDSNSCTYLGNFPQAFSHMGYILSAHHLDSKR